MLIGCFDVHYRDPRAAVACVVLSSWQAKAASECIVKIVDRVAPYQPGAFYRRELPCIEVALEALRVVPDILVIDGYVWLGQGRKGLGAHLYERMGMGPAVIGIAKSAFIGAEPVQEVLRGQSQQPLYISAAGIDLDEACAHVKEMFGDFRTPWAMLEADRLAREHVV